MTTILEEKRLTALVRDRWINGHQRGRKLCLILGAGADIASGGLTFWQLKKHCYEKLCGKPSIEMISPEDVDQSFNEIFQNSLPENERALIIEQIFRECGALEPSESYRILALLLKFGGLDAVITTNFDTMLEKAADDLGARSFDVFSPQAILPVQLSGTYLHGIRQPYVKVHGDLASRTVTVLTEQEIAHDTYEPEIEGLVSEIVSSHNLVIAGYSGHDERLAHLISEANSHNNKLVFWCNPSPLNALAPLVKYLKRENIIWLNIGFDRCIEILSREPMQRPVGLTQGSSFLKTILDWRVSYANKQLEKGNSTQNLRNCIPRKTAEIGIRKFLSSNKNIGVIIGPSGFGKSTLVRRLASNLNKSLDGSKAIIIEAKSLDSPDIEYALMRLCAPAATELGLSSFERWLRTQSTRILVIIDGLNEYSSDTNQCANLFRAIIRLGFALPENAQLRFLLTRQV